MKNQPLIAVIFVAACLILPFSAWSQQTAHGPEFPISAAVDASMVAAARIFDVPATKALYQSRAEASVWRDGPELNQSAAELIDALTDSWTHGLNPQNYHLNDIKSLEDNWSPKAEWFLTDAFVRYVRDMSGMRAAPKEMDLDVQDWLQPYSTAQIFKFLGTVRDMNGYLESLPPSGRTYQILRQELIRISTTAPEAYERILPIDFGGRLLKPNMRHARVPDLRLRLGATAQTDDTLLYDDALAAAVIRFQQATGQKPDGIVGQTTLRLLNRTRQGRIHQLIANLERLRWTEETRPDRFVVVNIPSATLWAIENGRAAFEMPVIVGRDKRPTPSFVTKITGVRFNPDWTVPPTIKREDILPKLQENPAYLTDKGMELIRIGANGIRETIDPATIDWKAMTPGQIGAFEMVQIPGAHNPLGQIRILMPNRYNVYLHDTNEPQFFGRALRAQSSGCVRMSEPEKMARFVMQGWDDTKIQKTLESGKRVDVTAPNKIPVYMLYYTAWVDKAGDVVYGNDIYDWDAALIRELRRIDGFSDIGHSE